MFRRRTRIARYPVLPSMRRTQRCVPGSKASRHLKRQGICGHRKLKLGRLWRPMPCLSCFHFCRAFKESIVLSPHTWLRQHRLEQAMNLLCDTGLSVVSVSQRRSAMPPKPCWRIQKRRRRFQKSQASRSRVKRTPLANATGDPATARTGDLRPTDDVATGSDTRKTQELITAAIAVVERMTTAATADPQGSSAARSNDADPRIAILMARPEIKSLSDLTGKKIAIDDKQSSSSTKVRTAIASVAGVQVSEGQTWTRICT